MESNIQTISSQNKNNRVFFLDCARAFAIISITVNHALSRSFSTQTDTLQEFQSISTVASFFKAVLYVFSRLGVPLFLMISGSLLLNRDYENKNVRDRFIKHNWLQLLITTEIWLTIMFWYLQLEPGSILRTNGPISAFGSYIETLLFINQTTMHSMWYMPMILCVYLMLPIMSVALKRIGNKFLLALSGFVVVSSMIIPNINTAIKASGSSLSLDLEPTHTNIFSYFLVYVLIGYWLFSGALKSISTKLITVAFISSFLLTGAFQFWIYSSNIDYFVRYADIGVLIAASCLFELFRRSSNVFKALKKPITCLSHYALGIYFLHICIMSGLNNVIDKLMTTRYFVRFTILEIVSFVTSIIIIWITSKSKVLAKYLYMIR